MQTLQDGFVVWMHHDNKIIAVFHSDDREKADAYARYMNTSRPGAWFEVKKATSAVISDD